MMRQKFLLESDTIRNAETGKGKPILSISEHFEMLFVTTDYQYAQSGRAASRANKPCRLTGSLEKRSQLLYAH